MDDPQAAPESVAGLPEDAARRLIGPRADYYLRRWTAIGDRGSSLGLNWPAFWLGPFWMLYRRMYRTFWLVIGAALALVVLEALAAHLFGVKELPRIAQRVLNIMFAAVIGVSGSYWYFLEVRRRYERIRAVEGFTDEDFDRAGGVSWGALALGVAVVGGLIVLGVTLQATVE